MKRRKTQQTLRAAERGLRKVQDEQGEWTFFQDVDMAHQWGSFSGGTTFSFNGALSVGDLITINSGDATECAFGLDLAYKPTNPRHIHPARRRKLIQDQKDMMSETMIINSSDGVIHCKKIDETTWVITGDIS